MHIQETATFHQKIYPCDSPWVGLRESDRDLTLTVVGELTSHGNFRYHSRFTSHYLHFFTAGSGTMTINGKIYPCRTGECIAFFPGDEVDYRDTAKEPWKYFWFSFSGRLAQWALRQCRLDRERPHGEVKDLGSAMSACKQTIEELQSLEFSGPRRIALTWTLLEALCIDRDAIENPSQVDVATKARNLIDNTYNQGISVEAIADSIKVNPSTLFRHFKKAFACSPKSYIRDKQMNRAKELLLDTEENIKSISKDCGFQDSDFFIRVFRQCHGTSPAKWRRVQLGRGTSN